MRIHLMLIAYSILVTYTRKNSFYREEECEKNRKRNGIGPCEFISLLPVLTNGTRHAFTAVYFCVYTNRSKTTHLTASELHIRMVSVYCIQTVYFHPHQRQFFPEELMSMRAFFVAMKWQYDTNKRALSINVVITKIPTLLHNVFVSNLFLSSEKYALTNICFVSKRFRHFIQKVFCMLNQNFAFRKDKIIEQHVLLSVQIYPSPFWVVFSKVWRL